MNKNIPIVILCGGKGTRLKEETEYKPKPLVRIGEKPILWHIIKLYAHFGFSRFILTLGYKGDMIKDYFLNHRFLGNDFTLHCSTNQIDFHSDDTLDVSITFVNTGSEALTGERLQKIKKYIDTDYFMVTYGDGVADINIERLLRFALEQRTLGTITGAHPHSKYGMLKVHKDLKVAEHFVQKPLMHDLINGGFMVFQKVFEYLDNTIMENAFEKLIQEKHLSVYEHDGFWMGMDTYSDVEALNELWRTERPWALWEENPEYVTGSRLA